MEENNNNNNEDFSILDKAQKRIYYQNSEIKIAERIAKNNILIYQIIIFDKRKIVKGFKNRILMSLLVV